MPKKRKAKPRRSIKKSRGGVEYLVLFLVVAFGILISGFLNKSPLPSASDQFTGTIQDNPGGTNNLQLRSPTFITATPAPTTGACNHDNGKTNDPKCDCPQALLECKDKKCVKLFKSGMIPNPPPDGDCQKDPQHAMYDNWCTISSLAPTDGIYCLGKPVIYLYPTKDTLVDVTVTTPGKIVVSDPLYPAGGWKKVLAHPGGKLEYQNKTYSELFYESAVGSFAKPARGVSIPTSNLSSRLDEILAKLGLIKPEREEFISFWVPRLEKLTTPYIFFSTIDETEKDKIDSVTITPKPDTWIGFIAYFKGIKTPQPDTFNLPEAPKARVGFTAVEWGGTIDYSN